MQIPDLEKLAAELQREDAQAALEVVMLMLSHFSAYVRSVEPFVPDTLLDEHIRVREDVEFTRDVCEVVQHAA